MPKHNEPLSIAVRTGGTVKTVLDVSADGVQLLEVLSDGTSSGPAAGGSSLDQTARDQAGTVERRSLTDGRPLVADRLGMVINVGITPSIQYSRRAHTVRADCAGLRAGFGVTSTAVDALLLPVNGMFVTARLETADGNIWDWTFDGQKRAYIEPNGFMMTDPLSIDFADGDGVFSRTFAVTAFGNSKATLETHVATDTTFTTTTAPSTDFLQLIQRVGPQPVYLDNGANEEIVTVSAVTGAGPFTYTCSAMTKVHASGVVVGHKLACNATLERVAGDKYASSDISATAGTAGTTDPAVVTTTLSAVATAGDTTISLAGPIIGTSFTIDAETVTFTNVQQGAPYIAYLTTPLAAGHASGATVTSNNGVRNGVTPAYIVADHVSTKRRKTVAGVGDSIPNGGGFVVGTAPQSWFDTAFADRPFINVSKAGDTAQLFVQPVNSRAKRNGIPLCDYMLNEYGTNDFYGAARTVAQMQADTIAIWKMGWIRGQRVIQQTITVRVVTSTDRWLTVAGQTANTGGNTPNRVAFNGWLRDGAPLNSVDWTPAATGSVGVGIIRCKYSFVGETLTIRSDVGHPLYIVADPNSRLETALDSSLWQAADAFGPLTYDGLHPTTNAHLRRIAVYYIVNVRPLMT